MPVVTCVYNVLPEWQVKLSKYVSSNGQFEDNTFITVFITWPIQFKHALGSDILK